MQMWGGIREGSEGIYRAITDPNQIEPKSTEKYQGVLRGTREYQEVLESVYQEVP